VRRQSTSPIGEWLTKKFVDWQAAEEKRKSVSDFADYLGVSRDTLNKYMNGTRKPTGTYVERIAAKLGVEIYDLLGSPRPDPRLQAVISAWPKMTEREREELGRQADKALNGRGQESKRGGRKARPAD
jgi:transcriptional regulator with XRE-family HTH domain